MELAIKHIGVTGGQIYNMGGGPENTISILELLEMLGDMFGKRIGRSFGEFRPGDQPIYISDIRKAKADFAWTPEVDTKKGITSLVKWAEENIEYIKASLV